MMVDRGNTDKHRTGITGNGLKGLSKVVEESKWGACQGHLPIRKTGRLAASAEGCSSPAIQD
jgi:hypothetical protein